MRCVHDALNFHPLAVFLRRSHSVEGDVFRLRQGRLAQDTNVGFANLRREIRCFAEPFQLYELTRMNLWLCAAQVYPNARRRILDKQVGFGRILFEVVVGNDSTNAHGVAAIRLFWAEVTNLLHLGQERRIRPLCASLTGS